MKKICILITTCLFNTLLYSQNSIINFTIESSNIKADIKSTNYYLPLTFSFTKDFSGKEIKFIKKDKTVLGKGKFGKDETIQPYEESDSFKISIDANRKMSFKVNGGDLKILEGSFFIVFKDVTDTFGPIKILSKDSTSNDYASPFLNYVPGYLYYDALQIKKLENEWKKGKLNKTIIDSLTKLILARYGITDATTISLNDFFKDNKFLKTTFSNVSELHGSNSFSSIITSVGGVDVTNLANGITEFMIKRAKEELTVAFFERFQKFAKNNPEFQILFPKTTENLSGLLSYNYPQMLPALRTGFLEDLSKITYNLDDVLALPRYKTLLQNFPEVRVAIRSLRLVHEIETGASNAADIIKEFSSFDEFDFNNITTSNNLKNVGSTLKIASLFSESVRNDTSKSHVNNVWVTGKELNELFKDKILFNIYMGLIYQQSKNDFLRYKDKNGETKDFYSLLAVQAQNNNLFVFQNKLKEFFELTTEVNNTFKDIKSKIDSNKRPSNDEYYNYVNVSLDLVDYSFSIAKIFTEIPKVDNYMTIAKKSNSLYKDIYTKKYSQAVKDAIDIFTQIDTLVKANLETNIQNIKDNLSSSNNEVVKRLALGTNPFKLRFVTKKDIDIVSNLTSENEKTLGSYYKTDKKSNRNKLDSLLHFIEKVKPYALFMANMVEAKDEASVIAALENVILPVGSSSIKKNAKGFSGNISVQSYLGAFWTPYTTSSSNTVWKDKFGVTAPIGISWTPGFLSWQKVGSLSIFASFLDLGAIVDYKLQKDSLNPTSTTASKSYSIQLGQIFSPGLYAVYGFPWKLPLSIGIGNQYGPGLSKVTSDATTVDNPTWRWNVFLGVDLPFFTLSNKVKTSNLH